MEIKFNRNNADLCAAIKRAYRQKDKHGRRINTLAELANLYHTNEAEIHKIVSKNHDLLRKIKSYDKPTPDYEIGFRRTVNRLEAALRKRDTKRNWDAQHRPPKFTKPGPKPRVPRDPDAIAGPKRLYKRSVLSWAEAKELWDAYHSHTINSVRELSENYRCTERLAGFIIKLNKLAFDQVLNKISCP